jgi:GH25 family lysozyme M1 (1,4-beta-N-acetylmuramidase)
MLMVKKVQRSPKSALPKSAVPADAETVRRKVRPRRKTPVTAAPRAKINPMVVDIYHDDKVTSFAAAHKDGIRGVIHKATQGRTNRDPAYARRRASAAKAGLLWGAYHFMTLGDPVAQADHFVDTAKPDKNTLVAIDHERRGVSLAKAIEFMRRVEERIGRKVVIYSGNVLKEQMQRATAAQKSYLAGRRLWLAQYSKRPKWPSAWQSPWLWQFTDGKHGTPRPVAGIPGAGRELDVDSYDGTAVRLAAEWAGEKLAAPMKA